MSERGEAAQARAMPCLRFFLTLRTRPLVGGGVSCILYRVNEAGGGGQEWARAVRRQSFQRGGAEAPRKPISAFLISSASRRLGVEESAAGRPTSYGRWCSFGTTG